MKTSDVDFKLYAEWRRAQPDPTQYPAWGNLPSEDRLAWSAVAALAISEVAVVTAGERLTAADRDKLRALAIFAEAQPGSVSVADGLYLVDQLLEAT